MLETNNEIESLKAQLTFITCQKVALDNSYSELLATCFNVRTRLAMTEAERDTFVDRLKIESQKELQFKEKEKQLLEQIELLKLEISELKPQQEDAA